MRLVKRWLTLLGFGSWPARPDRTAEHEQRLKSIRESDAEHDRRILEREARLRSLRDEAGLRRWGEHGC